VNQSMGGTLPVAQSCTLLYRRRAVGWVSVNRAVLAASTNADFKSAIRQAANLRYMVLRSQTAHAVAHFAATISFTFRITANASAT